MSDRFDYVVVGSGAGGGPLAANLAAGGYRVLVLEAGGDEDPWAYQVPSFHALASEHPDLSWEFYVRHYTHAERQRRDTKYTGARDGVLYPRAGTLGGCTAHNAMITIYPHDGDWDEIVELTGDESFNSETMRAYFERLERCSYARAPRRPTKPIGAFIANRIPLVRWFFQNHGRHGYRGWLCTTLADPTLALRDSGLVDVVLSAARITLKEDLGRLFGKRADLGLGDAPWWLAPLSLWDPRRWKDPNDWRVRGASEGLWLAPLSVRNGGRVSARDALLSAQRAHPDRLVIRTGALATRVLLEGSKAVGVEYMTGRHLYRADPAANGAAPEPARQVAHADREVILAAGAFNTPQLLKISGIGPRDELEEHGIPVALDLPGVGENLQDRYEVGVVSRMKRDFAVLRDATFTPPGPGVPADPEFTEWRSGGTGVYATNGVVVCVIKRSSRAERGPDLFMFGLPANFTGYYPGYAKDLTQDKRHFTWAILKAHTRNRAGTVKLRSADPRDVPAINFRYFDEGSEGGDDDLEAMADGVEFVRRLMTRSSEYLAGETSPGEQVRSREEIKAFVRDQAWGHHASCTCRMGRPDRDAGAVVDHRFRVIGVDGLRIVDASVFPRIPGFFIVTSVFMLSEKAADVILSDAERSRL
jgi:choline dehydrogenase-like flavoprotein